MIIQQEIDPHINIHATEHSSCALQQKAQPLVALPGFPYNLDTGISLFEYKGVRAFAPPSQSRGLFHLFYLQGHSPVRVTSREVELEARNLKCLYIRFLFFKQRQPHAPPCEGSLFCLISQKQVTTRYILFSCGDHKEETQVVLFEVCIESVPGALRIR